jgi:hypothetical protein
MAWHSFITSPKDRRKRAKNLEDNIEELKEEQEHG